MAVISEISAAVFCRDYKKETPSDDSPSLAR